ncbi:uncharacterized protein LOC133541141 isoform X2 [Nerophis ophidion]|uniref:uncharacterized protein LOC133541141 isoform X2 n=1 Tax=Nerophis ophidion TaxID=159077 RepID=UPI002ADF2532|nr:uncharacterized protein LOC133541141 isoform X2 [Nerophis ophidion]
MDFNLNFVALFLVAVPTTTPPHLSWCLPASSPHLDRHKNCTLGQIRNIIPGEFFMAGPQGGSDPPVTVPPRGAQLRVRGQRRGGAGELRRRLQPEVECRDHAITLTVRRRPAGQLFLDRENDTSVPLTQLPRQCGYAVETVGGYLHLAARYDACHVTRQSGSYVLALLWRGTPVKISCPVSPVKSQSKGPSSLCCSPYGFNVRLPAAQELSIKVGGEWTPMLSAQQCGYTLDRQGADLLLAAAFMTCGVAVKDGQHVLHLQIGESTFSLACPVFSSSGPPLTETVESFPWDPPFYLAPPFYPHPPNHDHNSGPQGEEIPPIFTSPSPELALEPVVDGQPLPLDAPQPDPEDHRSMEDSLAHSSQASTDDVFGSSPAHSDLQRLHGDAASPVQVDARSFQRPGNAFNPYYHYYHHPKVPSLPEGSDPGLVAPFSHLPYHYYFPSITWAGSLPKSDTQSSDDPVQSTISRPVPTSPWPSVHDSDPSLVETGTNEKVDLQESHSEGIQSPKSSTSGEKVEMMNDMETESVPATPDLRSLDAPYPDQSSFPSPCKYHHDPNPYDQTHSSEETVDPHLPNHSPVDQSNTPTTDETYDLHEVHPYFYSSANDEVNSEEGVISDLSQSWPPDVSLGQLSLNPETGIPQPPHGHFYDLYPSDISQQYLQLFQHPGVEADVDLDETIDCMEGLEFFLVTPGEAVQMTSDPGVHTAVLRACDASEQVSDFHSPQEDSADENTPDRWLTDWRWPAASLEDPSLPGIQSPGPAPLHHLPSTATVQLRIAKDESFGSYHPEARLPLSSLQGRRVYLEVGLLEPQDPGLQLLVHSCLAYTRGASTQPALVYDGCPGRGDSQLLPSPHGNPRHTRRISVSHFLHTSSLNYGNLSHLEDPEIYFLCVTQVCSTTEGDCVVGCINSPHNDV